MRYTIRQIIRYRFDNFMARGGRSIVAMNATARGGSVSRIVPKVEMVTALRTDVDLVVTEFRHREYELEEIFFDIVEGGTNGR